MGIRLTVMHILVFCAPEWLFMLCLLCFFLFTDHVHTNQHDSHAHDSHNTDRPEPNNHHAPNKTHLVLQPVSEWSEKEDKILFDAVVMHGETTI